MTDLNLRFLPWLRRGLAKSVRAGKNDAAATIDFSFKVGGAPVVQSLRVRGPGDVLGIDGTQVLRTDPCPNTVDFEPNYFPCIEFAVPDLPWLFTPTSPDGERLLPWLTLVTVSEALVSIQAQTPLPVLHTPATEPPPNLSEMWAWAHVQTTTLYAADGLSQALRDHPETFISRIVSPRNLQANTSYLACLVPTYKAGLLAGLGLPIPADVGQALAWTPGESGDVDLPVYFSWPFRTASAGDFETLVERLQPHELDETVGRRDLDLSTMGIPLPKDVSPTTFFFGALVSPTTIPDEGKPTRAPTVDPLRQAIYDFLTIAPSTEPAPGKYNYLVDDPIVTPPIYGREQLGGADLPPPKPTGTRPAPPYEPVWYGDVNTHPRTRGAAGLGVRIVRQHQEDFMARAWSDVVSLRSINQTLQQATFASLVANRWQGRVVQLEPGDLLGLTRSAHARILPAASNRTVWGQLQSADVPNGAISSDMERITRAGSAVSHVLRLVDAAAVSQHAVRQVIVTNPARLVALSIHTLPAGAGIQDVSDPGSSAGPLSQALGQTVGHLDHLLAGKLTPDEQAEATDTILTTYRLAAGHADNLDQLSRQGRVLTSQMQTTRSAANQLARASDQYIRKLSQGTTPGPAPIRAIRDQAAALQDALHKGGLTFPPGEATPPETLDAIAAALTAALTPDSAISAHLQTRITVPDGTWGARAIPSRLTASPAFDDAVYAYVCDLSPAYLLPGVGELPANTVGLLEANGEFVEAVLLGMNHEMSREMLWREYPADLSGTWFKNFWSSAQADIPNIKRWDAARSLGDNLIGLAGNKALVLLVKGDILIRYPNLVVYAVPATVTEIKNGAAGTRRVRTVKQPETQLFPVFSGKLDAGVKFFGFDANQLTVSSALGDATPGNTSTDGGYFFAFQEQPTEPRFGLDEYTPGTTYTPDKLTTWSELSWGHFMTDDNPDAPIYVPLGGTFDGISLPDTTESDAPDSTWGSSSGAMARIVLQRPVRMLVHASALLPEEHNAKS